MTDLPASLRVLVEGEVRFIIVGEVAAALHGSACLTQDLEVVYARDPENVRRIVTALAGCRPYPRGAPPGLPFEWSETTVGRDLNFTLTTALGDVDLLGELTAAGPTKSCCRRWSKSSSLVSAVAAWSCRH